MRSSAAIYVMVSLLSSSSTPVNPLLLLIFDRGLPFFLLFVAVSSVPVAWNRPPGRLLLGLPLWVWVFALSGVLLSVAFYLCLARERNEKI